jgi:uncharacterized protein (DUF1778 family)
MKPRYKKDPLDRKVMLLMTATEKKALKRAADHLGISVGAFVRNAVAYVIANPPQAP